MVRRLVWAFGGGWGWKWVLHGKCVVTHWEITRVRRGWGGVVIHWEMKGVRRVVCVVIRWR